MGANNQFTQEWRRYVISFPFLEKYTDLNSSNIEDACDTLDSWFFPKRKFLKSIKIEGDDFFQNAELNFKKINILIGKNGCGKTLFF